MTIHSLIPRFRSGSGIRKTHVCWVVGNVQERVVVREYHIYKEQWEPAIGKELECQRECGNAAMLKMILLFVIVGY